MIVISGHISPYLQHLGIIAAHSGHYGHNPQYELYISSNPNRDQQNNSMRINTFTAICATLGLSS